MAASQIKRTLGADRLALTLPDHRVQGDCGEVQLDWGSRHRVKFLIEFVFCDVANRGLPVKRSFDADSTFQLLGRVLLGSPRAQQQFWFGRLQHEICGMAPCLFWQSRPNDAFAKNAAKPRLVSSVNLARM